jgi:uncharacterized protein (TIGR03382 family)
MKTLLCAGALALYLSAAAANAAYVQIWQIGIDDASTAEFHQENFTTNPPPGSPAALDDDYYKAGIYSVGIVAADEDTVNFMERALTGNSVGVGDSSDRFHFNLAPADTIPSTMIRFTVDLFALGLWDASDQAEGPQPTTHDLRVDFNGVTIGTQLGVAAPTTWVLDTTAGAVNATTGENIIEVTRTGGSVGDDPVNNGGWIQYDYLRLESQIIPEPSSVSFGLVALAFAGLFRRRR